MSLSVDQQARAALAYIKQELKQSPVGKRVLHDADFVARLDMNFITLFAIFAELYGYRGDCLDELAALIKSASESWYDRDEQLKKIDKECELDRTWFLSNKMLGGVCYVDRYAGNLEGIKARIPYFKELGLTYLHLMPLFKAPDLFSDGGYAVTSYRDVNPALGTMEQLKDLAAALREVGISLVIDFVFNHTSNEHEWAIKALEGQKEFEQYYWMFPDRNVPDAYERTTREIFPDDHRGSFVQLPDGRYVWSTFYHFQWDLNYSNPTVFRAMASEMLFLANVGVNIFRMDAVAFIWKQMGTDCENRPEAHKLIRAYNALCRIACPSVLFKSEAIVHPDAVVKYIDTYECQLSYNPLQMALNFEALATRDTSLLNQAIERRHDNIPEGCTWINYVRSHDDIGWTFADEDAAELGKNGFDHRRFLNSFYVNRHPGSFSRGVPFQDNPRTGDCRISGTTASLLGLESGDIGATERILLAYSVAMSTGGVPLIYLGDEVGQLNDYSYQNDPTKYEDSRWVNRPPYPESSYTERHDDKTKSGIIYAGFQRLIKCRKATKEFHGIKIIGFYTGNNKVLAYQRPGPKTSILCLVNYSDHVERIERERFLAFPKTVEDILTNMTFELHDSGIELKPQQYVWLRFPTRA